MSFGDLKQKNIINTRDGRSMGKPIDIEFCAASGRLTALVAPGETNLLSMLRGEKCGIVIPWEQICKIGDDVILVDVEVEEGRM